MTPAFSLALSSGNLSPERTVSLAPVPPAGAASSDRSPFADLRHDLLIGLGALVVLVGVIAFSIFGEPRGIAEASPTDRIPAAATAAETTAAGSAEMSAEAIAWISGVLEQARIDAVDAYLGSVAQKAAEEAARRRPQVTTVRSSAPTAPAAPDGSVWDRLAQCESGGNWAINTGNGFTGGLQFVRSTWLGAGGGAYAPDAHLASREQQIDIATRVLASQGWGAWPGCSSMLGLR